ncbi:MAG: hypothetical protein KGK07_07340 [Chloroflexota bacterium]|nr:hypothetical protein [Chloroflexota bacterium]
MSEEVPTPAQRTALEVLDGAFDGGLAVRDFGSECARRGLRHYGSALAACIRREWIARTWPVWVEVVAGPDGEPVLRDRQASWVFDGGKDPLPQPASYCWIRMTWDGYDALLRSRVAADGRAREAGA